MHPLGLEFKQSSLARAWPKLANAYRPVTLGLTSLHPHAIVPSLLSDEGKRIVLPAFFQRGRDTPDKTRQTLTTAHRGGPTRRGEFASKRFLLRSSRPTRASPDRQPAEDRHTAARSRCR